MPRGLYTLPRKTGTIAVAFPDRKAFPLILT